MARFAPPQRSVRTRLSPPYRATIRLKVFQGRNSISWAKSVLPVFIKASRDHPGSLRQLQIVDTALCPETRRTPGVQSRRLSVNRTAVINDMYFSLYASVIFCHFTSPCRLRPALATVEHSEGEVDQERALHVTGRRSGRGGLV